MSRTTEARCALCTARFGGQFSARARSDRAICVWCEAELARTKRQRCRRCSVALPYAAFPPDKSTATGCYFQCRPCKRARENERNAPRLAERAARSRAYRAANPERTAAERRRYRQRNPERYRALRRASYWRNVDKERARSRAYGERNRERRRALNRIYYLRRKEIMWRQLLTQLRRAA